jgi:glutathione S-transferase
MTVYPLTSMRTLSRSLDDLPNLRAYLKRIGERPAYRRAIQKGGAASDELESSPGQ